MSNKEGEMADYPIFLVGSQRSGTTLLRAMLTQSRSLHIPRETETIPAVSEYAADYGQFNHAYQRWFFIRDLQRSSATSRTDTFSAFDLSLEEAEAALLQAAPMDYAGAWRAIYTASAAKNGKARWGDKSPGYVMHVNWLANHFRDAVFVHIIRDPRDVVMSMRRAGWALSVRGAAQWWRMRVMAGMSAGREIGNRRYLEVRYEDLIRDPSRELKAICKKVSLAYEERMLRYFRDPFLVNEGNRHLHMLLAEPVDPSRAYAWQREMPRRDVAEVETISADLMEKIGYEVTGARRAYRRVLGHAAVQVIAPAAQTAARILRPLIRNAHRQDPDRPHDLNQAKQQRESTP